MQDAKDFLKKVDAVFQEQEILYKINSFEEQPAALGNYVLNLETEYIKSNQVLDLVGGLSAIFDGYNMTENEIMFSDNAKHCSTWVVTIIQGKL
jgi:hypothetical protein